MKVKATDTFKDYRYICLPVGLTPEQYRTLKAGEVVDIKDKSLIETFEIKGLVTVVITKDEVKSNGNDSL